MPEKQKRVLADLERYIRKELQKKAQTISQLAKNCSASEANVLAVLMSLEREGRVVQRGWSWDMFRKKA